tara:strand:- start:1721 stop:1915 length:195 start_codon:yes stop_codon:yes gene_type:complete
METVAACSGRQPTRSGKSTTPRVPKRMGANKDGGGKFNALVADWLLKLTQTHKRSGFDLCFLYS